MLPEIHCKVLSFNIYQRNIHLLLCLILIMYIKWYFYEEICHIFYASCCFKVVLIILTWLNLTNGIGILNHEFFYHKNLKNHAKYSKRYLKANIHIMFHIYGALALSHQCECVSTRITSITEECLSQNRRIHDRLD